MKHILTWMSLLVASGFLKTSLNRTISSELFRKLLFLLRTNKYSWLCLVTNQHSKFYFILYETEHWLVTIKLRTHIPIFIFYTCKSTGLFFRIVKFSIYICPPLDVINLTRHCISLPWRWRKDLCPSHEELTSPIFISQWMNANHVALMFQKQSYHCLTFFLNRKKNAWPLNTESHTG